MFTQRKPLVPSWLISLDVKSSARRVPIASIAARGTCAALGTQCLDQLNSDDGSYLDWILRDLAVAGFGPLIEQESGDSQETARKPVG